MVHNADAIQGMIECLRLSGVADANYQLLLSQAFMKEAQVSRLWSAIGFDEWIQAARWWLLKAQFTLYLPDSEVLPAQAFADLLKASFILIDIFPQHPQRRFWTSEYFDVEILAELLKSELATIRRLGYQKPDLGIVESTDLRIWSLTKPAMRPKLKPESSYEGVAWHNATEELVWKCFRSFATEAENWRTEDCIIMILIGKDTSNPRIVPQNQMGIDLFSFPVSFASIKPDYSHSQSVPHHRSPFTHPQSQIETYQPTYSGFLASEEGFLPNPKSPLSVVFSTNRLTLSNSRVMNEFTAILSALAAYRRLKGVLKTIESLRGFILLFIIASEDKYTIVKHFNICFDIYELRHSSPVAEEDHELLKYAIATARFLEDQDRDFSTIIRHSSLLLKWFASKIDDNNILTVYWIFRAMIVPMSCRIDLVGFSNRIQVWHEGAIGYRNLLEVLAEVAVGCRLHYSAALMEFLPTLSPGTISTSQESTHPRWTCSVQNTSLAVLEIYVVELCPLHPNPCTEAQDLTT